MKPLRGGYACFLQSWCDESLCSWNGYVVYIRCLAVGVSASHWDATLKRDEDPLENASETLASEL